MLRVPIESFCDLIPLLRSRGVTHVDVDGACFGGHTDTLLPPATPAPDTNAPPTVKDGDDEEWTRSDRIAAENGWVDSPDEPAGLREQYCAGARVEGT